MRPGRQAGPVGDPQAAREGPLLAIVIPQARRRPIAGRAIGAFLSACFTSTVDPAGSLEGWLIWAMGASLTLMFTSFLVMRAWDMIRPGRLTLDAQGFLQTRFGRAKRYGWGDVERFREWKGWGGFVVAFDDLRPLPRGWTLRRINRWLRFEEALYGGWSMPPRQLADVLNEARDRWRRVMHDAG